MDFSAVQGLCSIQFIDPESSEEEIERWEEEGPHRFFFQQASSKHLKLETHLFSSGMMVRKSSSKKFLSFSGRLVNDAEWHQGILKLGRSFRALMSSRVVEGSRLVLNKLEW